MLFKGSSFRAQTSTLCVFRYSDVPVYLKRVSGASSGAQLMALLSANPPLGSEEETHYVTTGIVWTTSALFIAFFIMFFFVVFFSLANRLCEVFSADGVAALHRFWVAQLSTCSEFLLSSLQHKHLLLCFLFYKENTNRSTARAREFIEFIVLRWQIRCKSVGSHWFPFFFFDWLIVCLFAAELSAAAACLTVVEGGGEGGVTFYWTGLGLRHVDWTNQHSRLNIQQGRGSGYIHIRALPVVSLSTLYKYILIFFT